MMSCLSRNLYLTLAVNHIYVFANFAPFSVYKPGISLSKRLHYIGKYLAQVLIQYMHSMRTHRKLLWPVQGQHFLAFVVFLISLLTNFPAYLHFPFLQSVNKKKNSTSLQKKELMEAMINKSTRTTHLKSSNMVFQKKLHRVTTSFLISFLRTFQGLFRTISALFKDFATWSGIPNPDLKF